MSEQLNLKRANILGDLRAERDADMLARAFYESHDYRKIVNSTDLNVIIGRRGTGKSALAWKLAKTWGTQPSTRLVQVTPDESQIQAMRSLFELFGTEFGRSRSASKLAWRYALFMEVVCSLHFEKQISDSKILREHYNRWRSILGGASSRLRIILRDIVGKSPDPSNRLGDLAHNLQIAQIQDELKQVLLESKYQVILLVDKLDEGYEPDTLGTAIIDGLVQSVIDLQSCLPSVRAFAFVRDNIFRSIERLDPDYSRNIEGQYCRLHWDESQLFGLACARLRAAFMPDVTDDRLVWNRCSARGLQGTDGFKNKVLQFTLYRPRDVLSLLNKAFIHASDHGRSQIVDEDIESKAKEISESRLLDLYKEYEGNFPGIRELVTAFAHGNPERSALESTELLQAKLEVDTYPPNVQRHFALLDAREALRALYGMGFVGFKNSDGNFVFSHDGRSPDKEMTMKDTLLVHPCYWMAINATRNNLRPDEAAEIFDEHDIEVYSKELVHRGRPEVDENQKRSIGRLMSELDHIPLGDGGAVAFADWCKRTLRVLYGGLLRNIHHNPNPNGVQRRDIVGTVSTDKGIWARILNDYGVRHVVFEIKNYQQLGPDEFRQASTYLTDAYGKLGFIVTRGDDFVLRSERELDWVKEIYHTQEHKLIVLLTGKFLQNQLSKIRSKEKQDAPSEALDSLLDTYEVNWLSLKSSRNRKRR